jgi:hypothetical protein
MAGGLNVGDHPGQVIPMDFTPIHLAFKLSIMVIQ